MEELTNMFQNMNLSDEFNQLYEKLENIIYLNKNCANNSTNLNHGSANASHIREPQATRDLENNIKQINQTY